MALKRPVQIHQDYHIKVETVLGNVQLVCETPWIFDIHVNGAKVNSQVQGCFRDSELKTLDISGMLHSGENVVSFDVCFTQSARTYRRAEKAELFATEKTN